MEREEFLNLFKDRIKEAERIIEPFLPGEDCAQKAVFEAMRYSVLSGGKRLRPVLMREVYRLLSAENSEVSGAKAVSCSELRPGTENGQAAREKKILHPFMAALEFIHSYSLVHDDLPAMDNDMLRRGKPTTHAAYGEGLAILAGDGLLNYAFEVVSHIDLEGESEQTMLGVYRSIGILSRFAGVYGMIGGQVIDIEEDNEKKRDRDHLENLYRLKTGGLIKAAVVTGAVLAGAREETVSALEEYADCLGIAFQVRDDILDMTSTEEKLGKSVGQDEANDKLTLAGLLGIEAADAYVNELTERALAILDRVFGESEEALFLKELTRFLADRDR